MSSSYCGLHALSLSGACHDKMESVMHVVHVTPMSSMVSLPQIFVDDPSSKETCLSVCRSFYYMLLYTWYNLVV